MQSTYTTHYSSHSFSSSSQSLLSSSTLSLPTSSSSSSNFTSNPYTNVCEIIRSLGRRIGFPIPTLAMAQFLFHLTHFSSSFSSSLSSEIAYACLFVAGKLADTPKKLKDILGRSTSTQKYDHWRSKMIHYEKEIMLALHFQFNIPLPFDFLIQLCKKANCDKRLSRHAWVLLFDMYQTNLVIRFPPYLLAMSSLFLAAQLYDHEINSDIAALLATCKEDVHGISCFLLDFLIATTSTDKPCFEKYRTLKIALNEHQSQWSLPFLSKRPPIPSPLPPAPKRLKMDTDIRDDEIS